MSNFFLPIIYNLEKVFLIDSEKRECIPVGCVPPALYRTEGLCPGDLCLGCLWLGGVSGPGGSLSRGSLSDPLSRGQTDTCKYITLSETSSAGGKKWKPPSPLFLERSNHWPHCSRWSFAQIMKNSWWQRFIHINHKEENTDETRAPLLNQ